MDLIILEGASLYAVIGVLALLFLMSVTILINIVLIERRNSILERLLFLEKQKNVKFAKENLILKIKHGELSIDEE